MFPGSPNGLIRSGCPHTGSTAHNLGNIEAVSGPAAQDRPGAHEWTVWEGTAANKAEALQSAEKADPRVDLEWMRIRYERDLDVR